MKIRRRWFVTIAPAWLWWLTRRRPPASDRALRRQSFSPHPGGRGLRFSDRLRDLMRPQWLTYRRDPRRSNR